MKLDAYLKKIDWESTGMGIPRADLPTLTAIHERHVLTFPFENLEIFLTGQVSLRPDRIWEKLVHRNRGGWCFELNGLLSLVLKEIGFKTRNLMARNITSPGKPRTHQILLVEAEGRRYLADTGFGGTVIRKPFLFENRRRENHHGLDFQLVLRPGSDPGTPWEEPALWVVQARKEGNWGDLFGFTLDSFEPEDYLVANHFHVSAPVSSFHLSRVANKALPDGRWSLVDHKVRRYRGEPDGEKKIYEEEIPSAEDLRQLLMEKFTLELTGPEAERIFTLQPAPNLADTGF